MAEPTLQAVFGANATQTATTISINKADIAEFGLIPDANNTAESLLMSLIMHASKTLNEAQRISDPGVRQVAIDAITPDIFDDGINAYERKLWSVVVYLPYAEQPLDVSGL